MIGARKRIEEFKFRRMVWSWGRCTMHLRNPEGLAGIIQSDKSGLHPPAGCRARNSGPANVVTMCKHGPGTCANKGSTT